MKYKNTRTGFVLETNCVVGGEDWELVEEQAPTILEEEQKEDSEEVEEPQEELKETPIKRKNPKTKKGKQK